MAASKSKQPDLAGRVEERLRPLVKPGQRITVAFSGGLDSTVLLHLLTRIAPRLNLALDAVHINHGLQSVAQAWPAHCEEVCRQLDVRFACVTVEVDRASPHGQEAAAREARHAALRKAAGEWIAFAHHRADQAETLLHRLSRGAGVAGAASMREADLRGAPPGILRPLLAEPRIEIEAWATRHDLKWIEDPSNADTHYSRNFFRHEILAPLNARFPGAEAALARAAGHFAEATGLLDELAAEDLARVLVDDCASLAALRRLSPARLANLLRQRLARYDCSAPDTSQLHELMRQMHTASGPWRCQFVYWALCSEDERVWLETEHLPKTGDSCNWDLAAPIRWGIARLVPCSETIPGGVLELRPRRGGERIKPDRRRPARDLQTLAREAGIPPWWRDLIPVVWFEGHPIGWGPFFDARLASPPCRIELPPRHF